MQNATPFAVPPSVRFRAIYEEHLEFVRRSVRRRGVPMASLEDVVQDVFTAVYVNLQTFSGDRPIRHWISGVMRNVVAMYFRKREHRVCNVEFNEQSDVFLGAESPEDHLERVLLREHLGEALMRITDCRRESFWLYEMEEMPGSEIARLLGVPENTVRMRVRAARRQLASCVEALGVRESREPRTTTSRPPSEQRDEGSACA